MQRKDILYEVYWNDDDGNTFYCGCKTKQEVIDLIKENNLKIANTKIICTLDDKVVPVEYF